jgi:Cu/Ag efflux pump CusA
MVMPFSLRRERAACAGVVRESRRKVGVGVSVFVLVVRRISRTLALAVEERDLANDQAMPVAVDHRSLLITRQHFSVFAAMGFISIFGIAIQDAIVVVTYFQRLREVEGLEIEQAPDEMTNGGIGTRAAISP